MDVDSLKAELEKHLANIPDEHAPHGFRDRFDTLAEQYQAEGGDVPKSVLETELGQIRAEAEAAANAAAMPGSEAPPPRAEAVEAPAAPSEPAGAPAQEPVAPPPAAGPRLAFAIVLIIVVLAATYYFFRG